MILNVGDTIEFPCDEDRTVGPPCSDDGIVTILDTTTVTVQSIYDGTIHQVNRTDVLTVIERS